MRPKLLKELTDAIGVCAGGLCSLFEPYYKQKEAGGDYALLESYGFILAYVHYQDGLSDDEVVDCAAFLCLQFGGESYFNRIKRCVSFYSKLFFKFKPPTKDFIYCSIVCYNLSKPGSWDDFENDKMEDFINKDLNFFSIIQQYITVQCFLSEELPKRINPILERL